MNVVWLPIYPNASFKIIVIGGNVNEYIDENDVACIVNVFYLFRLQKIQHERLLKTFFDYARQFRYYNDIVVQNTACVVRLLPLIRLWKNHLSPIFCLPYSKHFLAHELRFLCYIICKVVLVLIYIVYYHYLERLPFDLMHIHFTYLRT